jgi:chromosome segregation ATPase
MIDELEKLTKRRKEADSRREEGTKKLKAAYENEIVALETETASLQAESEKKLKEIKEYHHTLRNLLRTISSKKNEVGKEEAQAEAKASASTLV